MFPLNEQDLSLQNPANRIDKKKIDYNTDYCKRKIRVVLTISIELKLVFLVNKLR